MDIGSSGTAPGLFAGLGDLPDQAQHRLQAHLPSQDVAQELREAAKKEIETAKKAAVLEAKDTWFDQQKQMEDEIKERQKELRFQEKKYNERIGSLDKRLEAMDKKEAKISEQEKKLKHKDDEISKKNQQVEKLIESQHAKLSEISGLSREEALKVLREELISQARQVAANDAKLTIEQIKLDTSKKAAKILSTAIQRLAVDHVSETTVSVVTLPSDEMKGRIIGREGRNIRTFEKATGVDLIIDDTPEAVVLSCFDPVRREIARLSRKN